MHTVHQAFTTTAARTPGAEFLCTEPGTAQAYGIPADNPARRDKAFAHWAPEVYCIGLRNVWKFSFDRKTGELWAGDVGQNLWEMVHRIDSDAAEMLGIADARQLQQLG